MLVLTRKPGDTIVLEEGRIVIRFLSVEGIKMRIGIEAPTEVRVDRGEVHERILAEKKQKDQK